jgi:hypothetical protein
MVLQQLFLAFKICLFPWFQASCIKTWMRKSKIVRLYLRYGHTWVSNFKPKFSPPNRIYTHQYCLWRKGMHSNVFSLCIKTSIEDDRKMLIFIDFEYFVLRNKIFQKIFHIPSRKLFSLRKAFLENVGISKIIHNFCWSHQGIMMIILSCLIKKIIFFLQFVQVSF